MPRSNFVSIFSPLNYNPGESKSVAMSGFFEEVKRRKVYRVAAAYIIAAGGIIQLASATFPAWELPNWALRLVILLVLVGFPIALIFAWAFDITAQGIRATPDTAAPRTPRRRNMIVLIATGVIISAATGFFLLPRVAAHKLDKSIAVLPFENLSDEKENAYFADGVQDEILTDLSKVADLKVISRTSVMQYKTGTKRNLREIAEDLGVAHVLEGSVQRAGGRVRVSAQLIDARSDAHLWAEHYDRDLADVFAIQSEVAENIVAQLKANLSTSEKAAIDLRPTRDPEAFDLYLQAKELINTFHDTPDWKDTLLKAIRLLDKAISRDGKFALAYCLATRANEALYWFNLDHTPARLAQAKASAQKALELAPDLGEAHLAQALVYYHGSRDY